MDMNIFSVNDVLHTLQECRRNQHYEHAFEHMLQFASELTGKSVDALLEAMEPSDSDNASPSVVNMDTSGLAIADQEGTWHTIDHEQIDGVLYFLMESDQYSRNVCWVVVDEFGGFVCISWDAHFSKETIRSIRNATKAKDD